MNYTVYILRCADGSFHVGHCRDLEARLEAHNGGEGAAYTAARRPVVLAWSEAHPDESSAVRRERQIKRWSRAKKESLQAGRTGLLRALSRSREVLAPLRARDVVLP
jgi:predicted GIY-YIG superfamily endonuclease